MARRSSSRGHRRATSSSKASVGYLDATIDELDVKPLLILPPGLRRGQRSAVRARVAGTRGHVQYDAHIGSFVITPRVDVSYQDTTFFDATNTREIAQLDDVTR